MPACFAGFLNHEQSCKFCKHGCFDIKNCTMDLFVYKKMKAYFFDHTFRTYVDLSFFFRKTKKINVEGKNAETSTSPSPTTLQKPHQKPKNNRKCSPKNVDTSPKLNMEPDNDGVQKNFIFWGLLFRFHVEFRGCMWIMTTSWFQKRSEFFRINWEITGIQGELASPLRSMTNILKEYPHAPNAWTIYLHERFQMVTWTRGNIWNVDRYSLHGASGIWGFTIFVAGFDLKTCCLKISLRFLILILIGISIF